MNKDRDKLGRFLPGSTPAAGHKNRLEHGVRSIQKSGEIPADLATPATIARERELIENLATEPGVVREQEAVARVAVLAVELAIAHVNRLLEAGRTVPQIPIFKSLPALTGCAGRELGRLFEMKRKVGMSNTVDYDELVRKMQDHA